MISSYHFESPEDHPGGPGLTWNALPELFPGLAEASRWLPRLQEHARLVEAAAPRVRVTSVPPEEMVRRHFAESLELWQVMLRRGPYDAVADVGSGGGWPGLVIAIVAPDVRVHLVEPLKKRAGLLRSMAEVLGLENVQVHPVRAEVLGRGDLRASMAAVTARAVARLPVLLEYVAPLAREGGLVALPRGSSARDDAAEVGAVATELGLRFEAIEPMRAEVSTTGQVVTYTKAGTTPERYPRRPGIPEKRPL